jgi:23S rRNA pseudouridine2605 synthase
MIEERIAKLIARSGACSRRDAEKIIAEGRVTYKNEVIQTPALKFTSLDGIKIDGVSLKKPISKLWLYHKPVGLIVSHQDEQGRPKVFDDIPISERVISAGRLDKNTSGLLLLTNDGEIARQLELPSNNFKRVYMVRVYGTIDFPYMQKTLSEPLSIEGVTYRPVKIEIGDNDAKNRWLRVTINEGKNREIRRIFEYFGLQINRLIRIQYGPFELADLKLGSVCQVQQIPQKLLEKIN